MPYHSKSLYIFADLKIDYDQDSIYAAKSHAQELLRENSTRRYEFVRWKQLIRLLAWGFLRFLVTIALCGGLYAALWGYSSRPPMDDTEKRYFNFIITALSMALGMNLASTFKSVALNVRWWILSQKLRPLKEVC